MFKYILKFVYFIFVTILRILLYSKAKGDGYWLCNKYARPPLCILDRKLIILKTKTPEEDQICT
jgi:hypothetical protein